MCNHVIVISVDAMINSDIAEFMKRRNMSQLLKKASISEEMLAIYPTYTYPCHTTIMTGCYPDKHGIYHNDIFDPRSDYDRWFWYSKDIKCPTLIDIAHEAGLVTGCVTFPVQGSSKADYLIAEIWAPNKDDDPTEVFRMANSEKAEHIFEKNKHLLNWMKTPEFDYFASACACDIIKEAKPNLLFVHFSYLDHQRHRCGVSTDKVLHAIDFIDDRIGEIMEALKDAGIADNTDFVILGDHGHMDVHVVFNINKLLAEKGYINIDENGKVLDYRIMVHSTSFSGHVYLKGISVKEARGVLEELMEKYPMYIERVMTKEEVREIYHLDGPFSLVLEAQRHVVFGAGLSGVLLEKPEPGNYKFSVSSHGYAPEKSFSPPFIISGPDASRAVIESARLVDEAPTIAALFGLSMPVGIDGHVLSEMIRF